MTEKRKFGKSSVFFDTFTRRPAKNCKNMHYCPGCGHGILHKLIAEAVEEYGLQDKTILIAPVGCAVFANDYFNLGGISVPHGRAPAVGTGIARALPDHHVISYQGDGDLAAIGFNEFIQAANRGEDIAVFFVNNSNYGMTGGQMAPTTLPGQKTTTSPYGRDVKTDGYPMHVCEMINTLKAPVYIERVALTGNANIAKARNAVRKAVGYMKERKGFSLVEVLSPCPINLKMTSEQINKFIDEQMTKEYPLGCLRDIAKDAESRVYKPRIHDVEEVRNILIPKSAVELPDYTPVSKIFDNEIRIKMAGFGGQGILSLGIMLATMGKLRGFNVSWLPSYGPEQRGGTANCSVIVSKDRVGSPVIDKDCDLLIAMTQMALEKFLPELRKGGVLLYDDSTMHLPEGFDASGITVKALKAQDIAIEMGNQKCANSVVVGALAQVLAEKFLEGGDVADIDRVFEAALADCFSSKPAVVALNAKAYYEGRKRAASK